MAGITDDIFDRHLKRGTFEGVSTDTLADEEQQSRPLRRLIWARVLGVITGGDANTWVTELQAHRKAYRELKEQHHVEADVKKHDPNVCNPLAKRADNPFLKLQANEDLKEEIWKDVERTYPEKDFFQDDANRKCIQQILYHWCKACNPAADAAESYRQGMNELAALCFYVVRQGEYSGNDPGGVCGSLSGRSYNEGDTFALFSALMERGGLRDMFAIVRAQAKTTPNVNVLGSLPGERTGPPSRPQSAVLARCDHVFNLVLKRADAELHVFLVKNGVEPQLFLLRWLRLLFCREFHIDDTAALWTRIFVDAAATAGEPNPRFAYIAKAAPGPNGDGIRAAETASQALPLVDCFAAAMVVFLRSQLLNSDESGCLQRLMKFPPVESVDTLVGLAKKLREQKPAPPAPAMSSEPKSPTTSPLGGAISSEPVSPLRATGSLVPPPGASKEQLNDPLSGASTSQVAAGAQDLVRGILSVGRQAVEGLANKAATMSDGADGVPVAAASSRPGFDPLARGAQAPAVSSRAPAPGVGHELVAELQQRVQTLEREKATVTEKAKQFIAMKTQELKTRNAELEGQVATLTEKLQSLEAGSAGTGQGNGNAELEEKLVELTEKVRSSEAALAAAKEEATTSAASAQSEIAAMKQQLQQAQAEQQHSGEEAVAAAQAEITRLNGELEQVRQTHQESASAAASAGSTAQAEITRLNSELEQLRQTHQESTSAAASAESAAIAKCQAQATQLEQLQEEMRQQLSCAAEELERTRADAAEKVRQLEQAHKDQLETLQSSQKNGEQESQARAQEVTDAAPAAEVTDAAPAAEVTDAASAAEVLHREL